MTMTKMTHLRLVALLGAVIAGAAVADRAHAGLPNALAQESIDLNNLAWLRTQNGIGTLNYNLNPGCAAAGADCYATTTLNGPAGGPAVGIDINQIGSGGGDANYAELYYYVAYSGPPGAIAGNPYPVTIHMSDMLNAGAGQAQAFFGFGLAQLNPDGFPSLASGVLPYGVGPAGEDGSMLSVTETLTDCASAPGYGRPNTCFIGAGSDEANAQPLTTLNNVMMNAGEVYLVDIWTTVSPANSAASAFLDPTFSAPSGSFSFSQGIAAGVPEPASWALMLAGVGMIGAGLRFSRRVLVTAVT
jgi:hypothetical protein